MQAKVNSIQVSDICSLEKKIVDASAIYGLQVIFGK